MKLKLRAVGTSTGVLLPKEMLVRLKLKKDDRLEVPPPDLQSRKQAEDQIDKRPAETKFRKNRKSDRHIFRHLI